MGYSARYIKEVCNVDLPGVETTRGAHGAKTAADKAHGESLCRGVLLAVKMLTGVDGILNYRFEDRSRREFDCAWPSHSLALELQGWTTHHRRGSMERDFIKLASAHRMGWKLYFATAQQAKRVAALWISAEITLSPPQASKELNAG